LVVVEAVLVIRLLEQVEHLAVLVVVADMPTKVVALERQDKETMAVAHH
jgi:hypothetical protein